MNATKSPLELVLVMYYIPTTARFNPSLLMWRWGMRTNLSCWLVPEQSLPYIPHAEWEKKYRADVWTVRVAECDHAKLIERGRAEFMRECSRVRCAVENGITGLLHRMQDDDMQDKAVAKKRIGTARGILWRARTFLKHARECAMAFDLTGDAEPLFAALRNTIAAQEAAAQVALKSGPKVIPAPTLVTESEPESEADMDDDSHTLRDDDPQDEAPADDPLAALDAWDAARSEV